jgi:hypothetical protein
LIGLSGCLGQFLFFKKLKRRRFSKNTKKKVNGLQPGFLPGHRVITFPIFLQSDPVPVPDQPVGPDQILKL